MFDGSLADRFEYTGCECPDASQRELAELTRQAMADLTVRHRTVLALRVFEDLPHAEVAKVLGCSELGARVAFFHAKRALKHRLHERGIDGRMLAVALAAFGAATLSSSAPAATLTVSAAALMDGALVGLLSAKAKIACGVGLLLLTTVAGWGLLSGGGWASTANTDRPLTEADAADEVLYAMPAGGQAIFIRYTAPWFSPGSGSRNETIYKHWYHLPDGPEGAVLYRIEQWDRDRDEAVACLVQNADARCLVDRRAGTVCLLNYRVPHGFCTPPRVPTLPTDPASMCGFILDVDGVTAIAMADRPGLKFERDPRTGWIRHSFERLPDGRKWTTSYDYTPFDPDIFEVPELASMQRKDGRDPLFQQGWGFLRVQGELRGRAVEGWARLPFVYSALSNHPPQLELRIADRWTVVDDTNEALVLDEDGRVVQRYPGGTFFTGLPRPWLGFEPFDLARRDFARNRMWYSQAVMAAPGMFECSFVAEGELRNPPVEGTCRFEGRTGRLASIAFREAVDGVFDVEIGHLAFSYHADLPNSIAPLTMPEPPEHADQEVSAADRAGLLWLVHLADETLRLDSDVLANARP